MLQAHIFYSGMVQGIGFRYTVQRMAKDLNLMGWVRNLKDGRVETLVEGKKEDVEQLLKNVEQHFGAYITGKQIDYQESTGDFKDFKIIL